jgi:replicative DNA helicase
MRDVEQLKRAVPMYQIVAQFVEEGLRQEGTEYIGLCPFHEERTPSFKVYTDEKNHEWFKCFGCGEHGDLITFLEKANHCDSKKAIDILEQMVGEATARGKEWKKDATKVAQTFRDVGATMQKRKMSIHVAAWNEYERALEACPAAQTWLLEARGLTMETARRMHFGYVQSIKTRLKDEEEKVRNSGWICFPRIIGDKVVAVKYRSIAMKAFSQMAEMENPSALFNIASISPFEPVFVTEGEFDAAILEQHGFAAVSIPNSSTAITPDMKARMKSAECVVLAGDNDGTVGTVAMEKLYRELEDNRWLLKWPGVKDANDYFIKTCKRDPEVFKAGVKALLDTAKSTPVEGFKSLIERLRSAKDINISEDPHRVHFPWSDIDKMNYTPPGGIVVIYSTYSGTGKSVFASQVIIHEAKRGEVVCAFSPEIRDDAYYALIAAQVVGPHRANGLNRSNLVSRTDMAEAADRLTRVAEENGHEFKLYVGWSIPESDSDALLKFIETAIKVTGATRFVIDTFDKIVIQKGRETETAAEGRTAMELERIGIKYGCSFIVIAQANKQGEDIKNLNRNELGVLRGCRKLTDVAYGVYLLHRKRIKQQEGTADDLLESICEVHLKKDRGRGPGKPMVLLQYNFPTSSFVMWSGQQEPYAPAPTPTTKAVKDTFYKQGKLLDTSKKDAYS